MILIITGPSGVGKNTIIDALGKKLDFNFSVSHTTRPKRVSEVNGKDYYFISDDEFQSMINNNELIEFYKVKRIELIGQINSELKKNINK